MGKVKGLTFLILGICAFEYASFKLNQPGLGQLLGDMTHSGSLGEGIDTVFRFMFEYYGRDFFYDKFAALGTAGQASMYAGLTSLIYNTAKNYRKVRKEEGTKKPSE